MPTPAATPAEKAARSLAWRTPRAVLAWFARAYARHLQRRALAELDNRLLADIRVTPAQARRESSRPPWRAGR
jgi:uncharacterized protein YjiS (DUF1127 family)